MYSGQAAHNANLIEVKPDDWKKIIEKNRLLQQQQQLQQGVEGEEELVSVRGDQEGEEEKEGGMKIE